MSITAVRPNERIPDVPHLTPILPINTRVSNSRGGGTVFTLVAPRTWEQGSGAPADPYYMNQSLYVRRIGDGLDELTIPKDSARRYLWRLRDTALGAADRSGVNMRPVLDLCTAIGATEPLFEENGVVVNNTDIAALPEGTVYYQGHPDKPEWMIVWEVGPGGHHHQVMGRASKREGGIRTIHTLPGFVAPAPEPPAEEAVLNSIAAKAWREGKRISHNSGWCGVYGQCLDSLMINETDIRNMGVLPFSNGDQVDRDNAARVPEGSLLYWAWRDGAGFGVYQRDDSMTRVAARTRRIWGVAGDTDNSHGHMIVARVADGEMSMAVRGDILQAMPEGVTYHRNGYTTPHVIGEGSGIDTWGHYVVTGWPL
jgi:hypothetical protein